MTRVLADSSEHGSDNDELETAAPRRPGTGAAIAVTLGVAVSLAPGLLPRTPTAQGLLTGVLVALAVGVGGLLRMLLRRGPFDPDRRLRIPILAGCALVVAAAVAQAWRWQNRLRTAMGFPHAGLLYWLECAVGATLVAATLIGVCGGIRWATRRVRRARGLTVALIAALAVPLALLPTLTGSQRPARAAADPTGPQAVSLTAADRTGPAMNWSSLGSEGRRFMSGPGRAIRVYAGLESAPDLDSRVALAMRELEHSGGLSRGNIVVMVPTGSGWVDANAATGMSRRFGGDVAMVALQYTDTPSWVSFLFDRRTAELSQRALFSALEHRLSGLKHPPHLYIYGQSLGATAGSAVFTDDADQRRRACAALWAGPPADRVHRSGATVLANSSDPVVQWSPELLWRAPDLTGVRPDAPHPQWVPFVTFVQTSADLLSALSTPPGHGHRYGIDQGTALGGC
ncbi:putative membrane protein [Nocardia sp. GAS34]|uniref:alpha/beta-hydrolase family protein n=1 Tax=unclassified Nocardia TaxID=2637762 RepID=UPI003D1A5ADF